MKAIITKFHGPTNTKGSRYSATDSDGNRVMLSADYALAPEGNYDRAALALCRKMHWHGPLVRGVIGAQNVYVFDRDHERIAQIRAANKAAGLHFFEQGTVRFFASCVEPYVYDGPGGVYFVTSEQFTGSNGYSAPRKWTVRRFEPSTGVCETVGQFNQYTKREARLKAKDLAR